MTQNPTLRLLPLRRLHESAGARLGPFSGWSMPLNYSPGVLKEHLHTRRQAGLFDISHMQLFVLQGTEAAKLVAEACPVDAAGLPVGGCKYSFLLNAQAGIIDDLIITKSAEDRFMIMANAARAAVYQPHLQSLAADSACTVTPLSRVILALQGPAAADVMCDAGFEVGDMRFMTGAEPRPNWLLTRSGYTGEDGFEIAVPAGEADALAERLAGDGRVEWTGLAARDTLRLEAGLCLYGRDIDETTDPVSAGLLWAIPKTLRQSGGFVGAERLGRMVDQPPKMKRVGLRPATGRPIRAGVTLLDEEGQKAGHVTSGGFGPSVGHPVAMGYVRTGLAEPGRTLSADIRGGPVAVDVHALPFVPHHRH